MTDPIIHKTHLGLEYILSEPLPEHRSYALRSMTYQLRSVPGLRSLSDREFMVHVQDLEEVWDGLDWTESQTAVALDPSDPWLVLGFVMGLPPQFPGDIPVLTWLHVRGGFRGLGLGTALAALLGIRHGVPAIVEYPTWDLIRHMAGDRNPIGLLHNPNWDLTLAFDGPLSD